LSQPPTKGKQVEKGTLGLSLWGTKHGLPEKKGGKGGSSNYFFWEHFCWNRSRKEDHPEKYGQNQSLKNPIGGEGGPRRMETNGEGEN